MLRKFPEEDNGTSVIFACEVCGESGLYSLKLRKFACKMHSKTRKQVFDEANSMMNTGGRNRYRNDYNNDDISDTESEEEVEEVKEEEKKFCLKCGVSVLSFKMKTPDGGICDSCCA